MDFVISSDLGGPNSPKFKSDLEFGRNANIDNFDRLYFSIYNLSVV